MRTPKVLVLLVFMAYCINGLQLAQSRSESAEVRVRHTLSGNQVKSGDAELRSRIEQVIAEHVGMGFAGAVFVGRDNDDIVKPSAFGLADVETGTPMNTEMIFDIGSVAKQFTGAALLVAEHRGLLKTTDTLDKFFPNIGADKAKISLEQIAAHVAGLADLSEGDFQAVFRDQAEREILTSKLEFPPGERYRYSNAGYTLLAIVLEKVTQTPFQLLVKNWILAPAHLTHTGWYQDPHLLKLPQPFGYLNGQKLSRYRDWPKTSWSVMGAGGMVSTIGDMIAWETQLRRPRVLPIAVISKLCTPLANLPPGKGPGGVPSYNAFGCTTYDVLGAKVVGKGGAGTDTGNSAYIARVLLENLSVYTVVVLGTRIQLYEKAERERDATKVNRPFTHELAFAIHREIAQFAQCANAHRCTEQNSHAGNDDS